MRCNFPIMRLGKELGIFFLIIFLLGISTSCGKKEVEQEKKKEIGWAYWGFPEADKTYQKIADNFENRYPDIKVKLLHFTGDYWMKVQSMMAGGVCPDILWLGDSNWIDYVKRGVFLPLDSFIEKYNYDLADFYPEVLDTYKYEGKLYGMPKGIGFGVIYYNKDLFDKEGISCPTNNWNWEEFIEKAKALTMDTDRDGKIDQYGFGGWLGHKGWLGESFWTILYQYGADVFNQDMTGCTLTDPKALKAIEFWVSPWRKYKIMPTPSPVQQEERDKLFMAGKIGMVESAQHIHILFKDIKNFKVGCVPFPQRKGERKLFLLRSGCFALSSQSKNPESAYKFIQYITSPEAATLYFKELSEELPPRKSLAHLALEPRTYLDNREIFATEIKYGRKFRPFQNGEEIMDILLRCQDRTWLGEDIYKVYEEGEKEINKILSKQVGK